MWHFSFQHQVAERRGGECAGPGGIITPVTGKFAKEAQGGTWGMPSHLNISQANLSGMGVILPGSAFPATFSDLVLKGESLDCMNA